MPREGIIKSKRTHPQILPLTCPRITQIFGNRKTLENNSFIFQGAVMTKVDQPKFSPPRQQDRSRKTNDSSVGLYAISPEAVYADQEQTSSVEVTSLSCNFNCWIFTLSSWYLCVLVVCLCLKELFRHFDSVFPVCSDSG